MNAMLQEDSKSKPIRMAALNPLYRAALAARSELNMVLGGTLDAMAIRQAVAHLSYAINIAEQGRAF